MADVQVETWPYRVTTGDFNGDGALDIITWGSIASDSFVTEAFVVYGDGRGGLAPPVKTEMPGSPVHLLVNDLDHDGAEDLIINWREGMSSQGGLSVVMGGPGGLSSPNTIRDWVFPGSLISADIDGDGWIDLAFDSDYRGIYVMHGREATFAAAKPLALGKNLTPIAFGDLDDDGQIELIARQDDLRVILSIGPGDTARLWAAPVELEEWMLIVGGQVSDFRGDARLEFGVAHLKRKGGRLIISEVGARGLESSVDVFVDLTYSIEAVTFADLNRDERADIVVSSQLHSAALIDGKIRDLPHWNIANAGDFDGDGRPEYVFVVGNERDHSAIIGLTKIDRRGRPTRRICKLFDAQRPKTGC